MLAADTQLNIGSGCASLLSCHLHKLPHTVLVQSCKRIRLINLTLIIITQELTGIVTGETKGHLGQIIGSEGEELCFLCNLICQKCGTRNLNHGSDMILDIGIFLFLHGFRHFYNHIFNELKLFLLTH